MSAKLLVTMRVEQRLAMSQQLRQAIALLQCNTMELKQLVLQHIESNPLIDIDEAEHADWAEKPDEYSQAYRRTVDLVRKPDYHLSDTSIENYAKCKTLRDYLLEQTLLCGFNDAEQMIAEAIIDAINEDGFLTLSLAEIEEVLADQFPVSNEKIKAVLKTIQTFEPAGIGAQSIYECLLIQLNNHPKQNKTWQVACKIVNALSANISLTNAKHIIKHLKVSQREYDDAITLIQTLNFYPGAPYAVEKNYHIEPELYVKKVNGNWQVFLSESILTHVKINQSYQALLKKDKKHETYASLKRELEEAKWLVNGLKKRNETLLNVASYIIEVQTAFLDHGPESMRPMNIMDVANALNLHESTVSRVTTGKYISTPRGVYELKYFFPSQITTLSGMDCSAIAVKAFIKNIIKQETPDHVYSDNEIVNMLAAKGITIARRTVAKYRESMNLLSSYQRQMQYERPKMA